MKKIAVLLVSLSGIGSVSHKLRWKNKLSRSFSKILTQLHMKRCFNAFWILDLTNKKAVNILNNVSAIHVEMGNIEHLAAELQK